MNTFLTEIALLILIQCNKIYSLICSIPPSLSKRNENGWKKISYKYIFDTFIFSWKDLFEFVSASLCRFWCVWNLYLEIGKLFWGSKFGKIAPRWKEMGWFVISREKCKISETCSISLQTSVFHPTALRLKIKYFFFTLFREKRSHLLWSWYRWWNRWQLRSAFEQQVDWQKKNILGPKRAEKIAKERAQKVFF